MNYPKFLDISVNIKNTNGRPHLEILKLYYANFGHFMFLQFTMSSGSHKLTTVQSSIPQCLSLPAIITFLNDKFSELKGLF